MSAEVKIEKIEKSDIIAPSLAIGSSAIIFQRHERYERDVTSGYAGSLLPSVIEDAWRRNARFFTDVLSQDDAGGETMVLFISSDTQYGGKGYRSMETAQVAQGAAIEAMTSLDINPTERIINFNPAYKIDNFEPTGQFIRPDKNIREPQIFESMGYVDHLKATYGGLNQEAWSAHEMDAEREKREEFGAEGIYDMLDRTKKSLRIMGQYSRVFHANNPGKRLIIWASSHYDTISPLVKDATNTGFDHFTPVDYGAGVVIELKKGTDPVLRAQKKEVTLSLGKKAIESNE